MENIAFFHTICSGEFKEVEGFQFRTQCVKVYDGFW